MLLIEMLLTAVFYPFTAGALALARSAVLRGDMAAAQRWYAVWRFFLTPESFFESKVSYESLAQQPAWVITLGTWLWRYDWYRGLIAYLASNAFPFKDKPWPLVLQAATPYFAVQYYWFIYVARDWASAQDSLRDAVTCGWSIDVFAVGRDRWSDAL